MRRCLFVLCAVMIASEAVRSEQLERKPMLGVKLQAPTQVQLLEVPALHPFLGIRVHSVIAGTVAERIGLQTGDIIFRLDDTPIRLVDDLVAIVANHQVGDELTIHFYRQGVDEPQQRQTHLDQWLENVPTKQDSQPITELAQRIRYLSLNDAGRRLRTHLQERTSTQPIDFSALAASATQRQLEDLFAAMQTTQYHLPDLDAFARRMLELRPSRLAAYMHVCNTYAAVAQYDQAIQIFEQHVIPRLPELATPLTVSVSAARYNDWRRQLDPNAPAWQNHARQDHSRRQRGCFFTSHARQGIPHAPGPLPIHA